LAYTTVQTVMDRLARKGLLLRRPDGKANSYRPARSREDHTAAVMQQGLHDAADPEAALLHFVDLIDDDQQRHCGRIVVSTTSPPRRRQPFGR
jgi:predicted transcriptional regulator